MLKSKYIIVTVAMILIVSLLVMLSGCLNIENNIGEGNEPTKYTLTLISQDTSKGTVMGGGDYTSGLSVCVSAIPNDGYAFDGWYQGNVKKSDESVYTFSMPAQALTLTAKFKEEVSMPDNAVLNSALSSTTFDGSLKNAKIVEASFIRFTSGIEDSPFHNVVETDNGKTYGFSYYYSPNAIEREYYYDRTDGENNLYYYKKNAAWHRITDNRSISYYDFTFDICTIFQDLDANDFVLNDDYYEMNSDVFNDFEDTLGLSLDTIKYVRIKLEDNKITEFKFEYDDVFNLEPRVRHYSYIITDYDNVSVSLPENFNDDDLKAEHLKLFAQDMAAVFNGEMFNFSISCEMLLSGNINNLQLWSFDEYNFGFELYSGDDLTTSETFIKENDKQYIHYYSQETGWRLEELEQEYTFATRLYSSDLTPYTTYESIVSMYSSIPYDVEIADDYKVFSSNGIGNGFSITIRIYNIDTTEINMPNNG